MASEARHRRLCQGFTPGPIREEYYDTVLFRFPTPLVNTVSVVNKVGGATILARQKCMYRIRLEKFKVVGLNDHQVGKQPRPLQGVGGWSWTWARKVTMGLGMARTLATSFAKLPPASTVSTCPPADCTSQASTTKWFKPFKEHGAFWSSFLCHREKIIT